ncbi:MAG: hypothetical protein ACKKL4_03250 [Patescibacteria group bacterium]
MQNVRLAHIKILVALSFACVVWAVYPLSTYAQARITIDIGSIDRIKNCQASEEECKERIEEVKLLVQALLQQILATQYPELPQGNEYYKQSKYLRGLSEMPLAEGEEKVFEISYGVAPAINRHTHPVYRETWRIFSSIVPGEYLNNFKSIHFYRDKTDRYSALVRQRITRENGDISEEWELDVNLDNFSLSRGKYNYAIETLAHETGHILLINSGQMEYFIEEDDCKNHYVAQLKACARDESYYSVLDDFWSDAFIKWSHEWEGDLRSSEVGEQATEELDKYYTKHEDEFVSIYAASGPDEDAAEVIAYLARDDLPKRARTIADKKIYSLVGFDEMSTLRDRVQGLLR